MPQDMENGAGVWEAAKPYGEPKSHQNMKYENGGRPVDFAHFQKFLVGTAVLYWEPLKCMGIIKT